MDDNASTALIMAFSVIVFVMALSLAMFMFSKVTNTSEALVQYSDATRFYDNIKLVEEEVGKDYTERLVSSDTIIPTLYRYYKENFCVKIYDADSNLIQIFDVNLEGKVNNAVADTEAKADSTKSKQIENYALKKVYNDSTKPYYLFAAPWLGNTENVKTRIDFFVNGKSGYINNEYVDYRENAFYKARMDKKQFRERFISYSYSGETMETEDGDILVTGANEKDKIVIIYTMTK